MLSKLFLLLFTLVQLNYCLDVWKDTPVNIAMICKGSNKKVSREYVDTNLKRMLTSLLYHSEHVLIILHVLTDDDTKPWVDSAISNVVDRHNHEDNNVTLRTEYLDVDALTSSIPNDSMETMKTLFGSVNKTIVVGESDPRRKIYFPDIEPDVVIHIPSIGSHSLDLFFMAPFYHRLLNHLDQVIVVDMDLEFSVGVSELQGLFSHLGQDQIMGLVSDQSAYYPFMTSGYGLPRQGVSTGVMLLQLDKMRESEEYNEELTPSSMTRLSSRFIPRPEWSLTSQDWFSLISWAKPHLVALLPCQYNVHSCSSAVAFSNPEAFSNIPCSEETAVLHHCGEKFSSQDDVRARCGF